MSINDQLRLLPLLVTKIGFHVAELENKIENIPAMNAWLELHSPGLEAYPNPQREPPVLIREKGALHDVGTN